MQEYENAGPLDCWDTYADSEDVKKFALRPGAFIELPYRSALHPPVYENLGIFSYTDLYKEEDLLWFNPQSEFGRGLISGALIKHLYTGHIYAYVPDGGTLAVANYELKDGKPTRIRTSVSEDWERVAANASGTRAGGTTNYSREAWPHYKGNPLNFLAQYELSKGEYIHVFFDYETHCDVYEDGQLALVDGGPVPSWMDFKALDPDVPLPLEYPNIAFAPIANKSGIKPTPQWANEDVPKDRNYKFLMQFGFCILPQFPTGDKEMDDFMCGDCGDWFLYYNPLTRKAWLTGQSG